LKVAVVGKWQVLDRPRFQIHVDIHLRGLKQSGAGRDGNGFSYRAHFQADVGTRDVIDENVDALLRERSESGGGHGKVIRALRQVWNRIVAGVVGNHLTGKAGRLV